MVIFELLYDPIIFHHLLVHTWFPCIKFFVIFAQHLRIFICCNYISFSSSFALYDQKFGQPSMFWMPFWDKISSCNVASFDSPETNATLGFFLPKKKPRQRVAKFFDLMQPRGRWHLPFYMSHYGWMMRLGVLVKSWAICQVEPWTHKYTSVQGHKTAKAKEITMIWTFSNSRSSEHFTEKCVKLPINNTRISILPTNLYKSSSDVFVSEPTTSEQR